MNKNNKGINAQIPKYQLANNTQPKSVEEVVIDMKKHALNEALLHILHDVVPHTPLKLEETSETEYDKGYIFYQDLMLRRLKDVEKELFKYLDTQLTQNTERVRRERDAEIDVKIDYALALIDDEHTQGHIKYYGAYSDIHDAVASINLTTPDHE